MLTVTRVRPRGVFCMYAELPVLLARDTLRIASASIAAPTEFFRSHRIPLVYIARASDRPSLR